MSDDVIEVVEAYLSQRRTHGGGDIGGISPPHPRFRGQMQAPRFFFREKSKINREEKGKLFPKCKAKK